MGFIPGTCNESDSDEDSEEYETDDESESDDSEDAKLSRRIRNIRRKLHCNDFIVQDPFFEVKDEDIDFTDDASKYEIQSVHLKNGFVLTGKFRKKRRVGHGSLTGAPLENKGIQP